MKTINVTFEDLEHEKLLSAKGEQSWRNFIIFMHNEVTAIYKDKQNYDQIVKDKEVKNFTK